MKESLEKSFDAATAALQGLRNDLIELSNVTDDKDDRAMLNRCVQHVSEALGLVGTSETVVEIYTTPISEPTPKGPKAPEFTPALLRNLRNEARTQGLANKEMLAKLKDDRALQVQVWNGLSEAGRKRVMADPRDPYR